METTQSFKDFLRDYSNPGADKSPVPGDPSGPLFVAHDIPKRISDEFRDILYTGQIQMVTMTLLGNQVIPKESHESDQMFLFYGPVLVTTANEVHELGSGSALVVPAGTEHEIMNLSDTETRLISVYGRPEH